MFQYIESKGLKPALWVNIYGANYENPAFGDQFPNGKYPENFFLRDKNGNLSGACCTADKTVVRLDYTNPQVVEKHLKPLFKTLVNDWKMRYLKDAGWGTWMDYYENNKERAYDSSIGSREGYRIAQKPVRKIMGPDNYILGCAMHEIGVGFGIFDGSRTGGDDHASWGGMQVYFNSMFGCNFLKDVIWYSNPDTTMVRAPLTIEEGQTIVSSIALTGQHYFASDFMAKLPEERMELYRKTMPPTDIAPIDLFPFRTKPKCCPTPKGRPRALDLKVNAVTGTYDVAAVYNWSGSPAVKSLSFGKDLGLPSGKIYPVTVKRHEVHQAGNAELAAKLAEIYNVEANAPLVLVGDKAIQGDDRKALRKLEQSVRSALQSNLASPLDRLNPKQETKQSREEARGKENGGDIGSTVRLWGVIAGASADAVNPSAFAVLTLLLGTILLASRNRKRVLGAGLAFTTSTFVSYLLMGFSLYQAFTISGIRHYIYIVIGILAILIGLWNMKDYFWYGRFLTVEVPQTWQPKLKRIVSGITSIPGAFFVGFLTSLFLLPCTSGPYLPVIAMLSKSASRIQAVWLLVLYNAIFVLPFLCITLAVTFGLTTTARIERWRKDMIPKLHLAVGMVIFLLGVVMVSLAAAGRI